MPLIRNIAQVEHERSERTVKNSISRLSSGKVVSRLKGKWTLKRAEIELVFGNLTYACQVFAITEEGAV